MKHTQGKWECTPIMNFSDTLVSFISTKEKSIAQLRGCITGEEKEAEANARLIAAAPELLYCLQRMVAMYGSLWQQHYGEYPVNHGDMNSSLEAIKKATTHEPTTTA